MTYEELRDKIACKEYNSKLPYPPFRENPHARVLNANSDRTMRNAWREDEDRLRGVFESDLQAYVESQLGRKITAEQFGGIFNMAWENGHASGYNEVLIEADDLVSVIKLFVDGLQKAEA